MSTAQPATLESIVAQPGRSMEGHEGLIVEPPEEYEYTNPIPAREHQR